MTRRFLSGDSRLRVATALQAVRRRGYTPADLRADIGAGLILGVVALPLSMALAIAAGAPPEHGLFTAIIGGIVIAVFGGSMHSVSGPTAAFVVLLAPVTARYGLEGLLVATLMAGMILVLLGVLRFGSLIQFVPHPVTTGFTAGIAVVIAVLQLGDFLGVGRLEGDRIWERIADLIDKLPDARWPDIVVGFVTLAVLVWLPKLTRKFPAPLVALVVATVVGVALSIAGHDVETIRTQFGGIPAVPPLPRLPWSGSVLTWEAIGELAPTAAAIALLGAIESLLCAVVADGMAGGRHDPDAELIGLGIGNMVVPFFGGFAATGAIARTATAIRAGGRTPFAVVVHSVFLLVAIVGLAPALGYIPMAAMAGLLLVVAKNMSEADHFIHITRIAPRSDVTVLVVCFGLTVAFDMVIAVSVGVVLAALLFMRRMVEISGATLIGGPEGHTAEGLPPGVVFYDIAGPLFFGAAEKALDALTVVGSGVHTVIIDLEDVPVVDATGLVALESAVHRMNGAGIKVVLAGVKPQPQRALAKAGFADRPGELEITTDIDVTITRFID
ncbi:MAG TPA: C4-dicarboxylic acid transporter DauA [Acidimicrobiia bacterium]